MMESAARFFSSTAARWRRCCRVAFPPHLRRKCVTIPASLGGCDREPTTKALEPLTRRGGDQVISTSRIRGILLGPRKEWPVIEGEQTTTSALYVGWIVPLAAIGPIASFVGMSIFGISLPFAGHYRIPIASGVAGAVAHYIGALVGVYVLAVIIDVLAPKFGGQSNRLQALKVAAYSSTAAWIAAIFGLIPAIAIL